MKIEEQKKAVRSGYDMDIIQLGHFYIRRGCGGLLNEISPGETF